MKFVTFISSQQKSSLLATKWGLAIWLIVIIIRYKEDKNVSFNVKI